MVLVQNVLECYSKLSAEDLDFEFKTLSYEGMEDVKGRQVYIFKVEDPRTMVEILTTAFGEARYSDKNTYLFLDGSKAKYIKCRDCYEITRFGKLLARLTWRR